MNRFGQTRKLKRNWPRQVRATQSNILMGRSTNTGHKFLDAHARTYHETQNGNSKCVPKPFELRASQVSPCFQDNDQNDGSAATTALLQALAEEEADDQTQLMAGSIVSSAFATTVKTTHKCHNCGRTSEAGSMEVQETTFNLATEGQDEATRTPPELLQRFCKPRETERRCPVCKYKGADTTDIVDAAGPLWLWTYNRIKVPTSKHDRAAWTGEKLKRRLRNDLYVQHPQATPTGCTGCCCTKAATEWDTTLASSW